MSTYLSNLLTQTTTHYKSLKKTLLANEEDGDTEDDSHISRVLRAYYTEKGRPFPPWLPPDPNDRRSITPQPYAQQNSGYFNNASGRGQLAGVQQQQSSGRSSLSDLWDPPAAAQNNAPMQPQSLRNARRPVATAQPTSNPSGLLAPQARPLPSQREGSYQSMQSQSSGGRPSFDHTQSSSSQGTAQDRLKARLWGGGAGGSRSGSPGSGQNPYEPPSSGVNTYQPTGRYGR